jgi:L-fucose isomerase-like protein
MQEHPVAIGVVCLARKTYDWQTAGEIYQRVKTELRNIEAVDWVFAEDLVIEAEEARSAAETLAGKNIDGLVCISGTFHLGHLVLELEKVLRKPLLLWAWDELPYNGGKIRLNSLCGLNLNASNLYKAGVRNYHACIGNDIDEDWIDAVRILARFKKRPRGAPRVPGPRLLQPRRVRPGCLSADGHPHRPLRAGGRMELRRFRGGDRGEEEAAPGHFRRLGRHGGAGGQGRRTQREAGRLPGREQADGPVGPLLARIRRGLRVSPCAAMSLLQSEDRILACEGDVEGALSMLAHQTIGAETPYLFDFSQVNFKENFALFWHCGVAPCNLWDGTCVRSLDTYFAGGKGVTADFVLKSGELSILRIDSAGAEYRLFLQRATAVPMTKDLKGTYMKAVFDRPVREVVGKVIDNGIAHHASVVYGDFIEPLRILAKIQGWRVIE